MIQQQGKIGVFDSGLGGLTILKEMVRLMPDYGYVYLGDNENAPYGDRSQEDIFELTLLGVEWLFNNGAEVVVLACNTASTNALRRIQQDVLPLKYQAKRVLGIIIPTVEDIADYTQSGRVGLLATKATVESGAYVVEMKKRQPCVKIVPQVGGELARLIEADDKAGLNVEISRVIDELLGKDKSIDTIILGCTHYALIENEIRQVLPENIRAIGQGELVAAKLASYLGKHPEIAGKLSRASSLSLNTTSDSEHVKRLMAYFYGGEPVIRTVASGA